MSRGVARWRGDMTEFAALLEQLGPHEGITLGSLRPGLNGAGHPNRIARSRDYLSCRSGEPALVLIDFDRKSMPIEVAERLHNMAYGLLYLSCSPGLLVPRA
jgi:hypothetical protein